MSVVFNPLAKFWPKTKYNDSFCKDERGIVTIQMVLFSVMIFGGVGLMMDFGRAYSAHSQMQGYIDQVALAAAEQLDGKSDAIARATSAANAVSKESQFISGSGSFQLSSLTFMSDAPTDANGDFSKSLAATHNTNVPELAKFVLAEASSTSVAVTMLNFASSASGGITDIDIAASAVATARTVSCGGLTPMVMCNPYENATDTSWEQEIANGIGYRMKLTANDTSYSKPSNYVAGNWQQIRLGLLKRPDLLMNVRNTICTNTSNLPGDALTTSDEMRRDICMLATVNAGLSCVNDQVAFRSAHPEAITTGLGVVFDMYDGPMEDIMDQSQDITFTHTFPSSLGFATDITRSSLFYPDPVSNHGRMPREDYEIYLDNKTYHATNTITFPFFLNAALANIANERAAYGVDPNISEHSRLNLPFATGKRTEWGPAPKRTCLEVENCDSQASSSHPTIYPSPPGLNEVSNYASSQYNFYLRQQYANANPSHLPDWWNINQGLIDSSTLVGLNESYYDFYRNVERVTPALLDETAIAGHDGNDGTGAWVTVDYNGDANGDGNIEFDFDDVSYGHDGTQVGPRNYTSEYLMPSAPEERRVQRVTVVNCEAAEAYASATGDTSQLYNDTYVGEVVDVVDLFMITPPNVSGCNPVVSNDPESNYLCDNADVTRVDLDVELVDAASINSVNFDARFYAVLVH